LTTDAWTWSALSQEQAWVPAGTGTPTSTPQMPDTTGPGPLSRPGWS